MAVFREEDHPRDDEGKFTKGYRQNTSYKEIASAETSRVKTPASNFTRVSPNEMVEPLKQAKMSHVPEDQWRVSTDYTASDYAHADCFVTDGGSTVAVKDGDIISVCHSKKDTTTSGHELLMHAVQNGGVKLDAFGEELFKYYSKNGFKPISWTPFDVRYAPDGWKPEYGEEPVIFYAYVGEDYRNTESYDDFLKRVKPSDKYEDAQSIRDGEINNG